MQTTSTRPVDELEKMMDNYGDMLFRICLVMLKNKSDAEDAVQETVLKYAEKAPAFDSDSHEKAWLITVAKNKCRDMHRFCLRHPQTDIDTVQQCVQSPESCGIVEALMTLPEKYRLVMLLCYVEEYKINEIARIIARSPSAVKTRMQKGRKMLEEVYRKEYL